MRARDSYYSPGHRSSPGHRNLPPLTALLLLGAATLMPGLPPRVGPVLGQGTLQVSYAAGWNLVGAPAGTQFAGAEGDLWYLTAAGAAYLNTQAGDGVEAGQGYWAYFPTETEVSLPQSQTGPSSVDAPAGVWLMLGNPSTRPLRLNGADTAYQYDPTGGYSAVSVLAPGRGAFVYSEAGGSIDLSPAPDLILAVAPVSTSPPAAQAGPIPATTTAPPAAQITVLASGFGQSRPGRPVTVAALLRNDGAPTDLIPVSITVFDALGSVIAAGDTTLRYLGSGETTGLAHRLTPSSTGVAARVDVQAGSGRAAGEALPGTLSFAQIGLASGRSGPEASAVISSTYAVDLSAVHVNAIVYDASGTIIGGGSTTKRLVPAGGSVGVLVTLDVSGAPARVDFYAQLP